MKYVNLVKKNIKKLPNFYDFTYNKINESKIEVLYSDKRYLFYNPSDKIELMHLESQIRDFTNKVIIEITMEINQQSQPLLDAIFIQILNEDIKKSFDEKGRLTRYSELAKNNIERNKLRIKRLTKENKLKFLSKKINKILKGNKKNKR